ncbi:hypothetical protein E6C27_scaffold498G001320 [Cucumis melo var. makuwa]|uniref:Uncharacterized protein n=1 Tax=Cucumis melo var. makuwa TaxID=1194695 RepID=A0A5A7U1J1_CUCMM|nr:hypothetical protein E6C27_scaffold498G001320 [Cucumis melo var. makuwa]
MTNDQHQREMKTLKAKPFHEENNDDKLQSRVPSCIKRKLSVDINTEVGRIIIFIFIFAHVLQPRGSSSSSSHICCSRENHHLHFSYVFREDHHLHLFTCVAVERIIIFIFSHMLQSRESSFSSSNMCYSQECHHLYLLTCVAVEKIFIFNFIFSHGLQPRGPYSSLSSMRSREDHHLHLQSVAAERIFIFCHMLQPRGSSSSSSMCCSQEDHHLRLQCCRNGEDHLHLRLQHDTTERIILFIFNVAQQKRSSSSSSMWRSRNDRHLHLQCGAAETIIIFILNVIDHHLHLQCDAAEAIVIFNFNAVVIFNFNVVVIFIFNVAHHRRSSSSSSMWYS